MRWLYLAFATGLLQGGQTSSADEPKTLLNEVRKKIIFNLTQLPRYLCTETVSRRILRPAVPSEGASCDDLKRQQIKGQWKVYQTASDRLHLDVAVSGDDEMYSWVGEDRFHDQSLADLAGGGATSTGAFATFLGSIFANTDTRFSYLGSRGDGLAEFGFFVSLEKSHYSIGTPAHHTTVAYNGSFLVSKQTASLVQLTVRAIGVLADLGVCKSTTTLTYENNDIGGAKFLFPKSAQFFVVRPNGNEFENKTAFSACREFHGESTLSFDRVSEASQATAAPMAKREAEDLPAGLTFTLALSEAIDSSTAAAGDLIKGRLIGAIKDKHKATLIPKNATVLGRIVQVERLYGVYGQGIQSLRIGIKTEAIEDNGVMRPFSAELLSLEKRRIKPLNAPPERQDLGSGRDRLVRREDLGTFDQMAHADDMAVGYLLFDDVTTDYVVHAGTEMTGFTGTAPQR